MSAIFAGKSSASGKAGPSSEAGFLGKENPQKSLRRDAYTVGCICALKEETAAARAMLDDVHQVLEHNARSDQNSYILGQVQKHKIVIVYLPAGIYGTDAAATVANNMVRTFPSIKVCLVVGIAGKWCLLFADKETQGMNAAKTCHS